MHNIVKKTEKEEQPKHIKQKKEKKQDRMEFAIGQLKFLLSTVQHLHERHTQKCESFVYTVAGHFWKGRRILSNPAWTEQCGLKGSFLRVKHGGVKGWLLHSKEIIRQ